MLYTSSRRCLFGFDDYGAVVFEFLLREEIFVLHIIHNVFTCFGVNLLKGHGHDLGKK